MNLNNIVDGGLIIQRRIWLRKNRLSVADFAREIQEDLPKVSKWFRLGLSPQSKWIKGILSKYPDFPL